MAFIAWNVYQSEKLFAICESILSRSLCVLGSGSAPCTTDSAGPVAAPARVGEAGAAKANSRTTRSRTAGGRVTIVLSSETPQRICADAAVPEARCIRTRPNTTELPGPEPPGRPRGGRNAKQTLPARGTEVPSRAVYSRFA